MANCISYKTRVTIAVSLICIILLVSAIPIQEKSQNFHRFVEHPLHVITFAIVAIFLFQTHYIYGFGHLFSIFLTFVVSIYVETLAEFIQTYVPGREPGLEDIGLAFLGNVAGICLIYSAKKVKPCIFKKIVCE